MDTTIRWVLPAVLAVGLFGEVRAARAHRRFWVAGLGAVGSLVLYAGWYRQMHGVLYGGMGLLFFASALTFWAKRHPQAPLVKLTIRRKET